MAEQVKKKPRKPDPKGRAYYNAAARIAMNYCPPIYPCADCGWPVIDGYCCGTCGSNTPKRKDLERAS